jgi:hypothetical protein
MAYVIRSCHRQTLSYSSIELSNRNTSGLFQPPDMWSAHMSTLKIMLIE